MEVNIQSFFSPKVSVNMQKLLVTKVKVNTHVTIHTHSQLVIRHPNCMCNNIFVKPKCCLGCKGISIFTTESLGAIGQLCKEKILKQKSLWMTPILLKFPWWCGKKNHKGNNLCLWHVHKNWHVSIRSWHMVKNFTFPTTSMSFVPFFWCHVSLENVQTSYRNGSKLVSKWQQVSKYYMLENLLIYLMF